MSDRPAEPEIRMNLLGRFEVRAGDRTVIDRSWNRRKAMALLKLLALQKDRSLHREQVLEALWPQGDPAAAAHNLRQNLHYLRTELAERGVKTPIVILTGDMVNLSPEVWIDIDAFKAQAQLARASRGDPALFERALALYTGDPLPEELYEEWAQPERDELRALREELLMELSLLHEARGQTEQAVAVLHQVLLSDPLQEEAHRRLMRSYTAAGSREKALRQYKKCRDILERELGVEPSAETEALHREILEGRLAIRPVALAGPSTQVEPGPKAVLISQQPESPGKHHITGQRATIGREPDNTVVLESPEVSRHHARIDWTGSAYLLEDLGSKNGTWLNENRLQDPTPVNDGDSVRFGDLTFAFTVEGARTLTLRRTPRIPGETATIMFTDLEGHTQLFERLGSEAVYRLLEDHLAVIKDQVTRHSGRTVKTQGDGLMASFSSVRQAVDCAVRIQELSNSLTLAKGEELAVRIGINSGEVLKQGADLIGFTVTKAERVMRQAVGGQIYLSDVSRGLLGPATGLTVLSRGWQQLKGMSRKERVFEVVWR